MVLTVLNKVLYLLFFLSVVTIIRHLYYFIQAFLSSTEEEPIRYTLSKLALLNLGLAVAYVLTSIFTGIKI